MAFRFTYKTLALVLSLALMLSLFAGCGKEKGSHETESNASVAETIAKVNIDLEDPEQGNDLPQNGAEVKVKKLIAKKGMANGVDVSKWQGKINWQKVRADGIDFAIIRIGFRGENGMIYKDAYADYNIQQAEKAGLLIGVYFFSTATSAAEATQEAEWTYSVIKGYPISYPVVYDCEGFRLSESRLHGLTNAQRTNNALTFLNYIKGKGYEGMFYSSVTELENSAYWNTKKIEASYKVWVANYPAITYPKTPHPDYSGEYDMWQYTNMGLINGINGHVDLIVSYARRPELLPKQSTSRPKDTEAPESKSNIYTAVSDQVTAKEEVNLRAEASTNSKIIGVLKNGEFLQRVATGSNGYSKLNFNGNTVFAISRFLTTDRGYKPPLSEVSPGDGFTPAEGKFTAKDTTNLRAQPTPDSQLIATIKNGEFFARTGVNTKGWTRLLYNGKTVYAKSSLLTTEINSSPEPSSAIEDDGYSAAIDRVTAKSETNLRTVPSSSDSSTIVYTLKKGEFLARTGTNTASGWSKLLYNGKTVYAITSFLLTESEFNTSNSNSENAGVQ